jgi:hypothetical protein
MPTGALDDVTNGAEMGSRGIARKGEDLGASLFRFDVFGAARVDEEEDVASAIDRRTGTFERALQMNGACLDTDLAALARGVSRVEDKSHEDGFEEGGSDEYARVLPGERQSELHALANEAAQNRRAVGDSSIRGRSVNGILRADEVEEISQCCVCPHSRIEDARCGLPDLVARLRIVEQELGRGIHDHYEIVELVGEPRDRVAVDLKALGARPP